MMKPTAKKCGIAAIAGAALVWTAATVQAAQNPNSSAGGRAFVKEAIQGDLAEMKIGRLAQRKGVSERVKKFGRRLENDHAAALQKARPLAASLGTTPPATPNAKQKATYDQLSRLSGAEFDRQFAKTMVKEHKKDIEAFKAESRGTGRAAAFAKQTLPTLEAHLKLAKSLTASKT